MLLEMYWYLFDTHPDSGTIAPISECNPLCQNCASSLPEPLWDGQWSMIYRQDQNYYSTTIHGIVQAIGFATEMIQDH